VKFVVLAVGHRMPDWIRAGFEEYARRMPRETAIVLKEIRPAVRGDDSGAGAVKRILEDEYRRIRAALPAGARKVLLDEAGVSLSTSELAQRLERWRAEGRDIAFVIGGAEGTAAALKAEADFTWSLSKLTLPHGLVRVMLAEQLYRAVSLLAGHPYHRP